MSAVNDPTPTGVVSPRATLKQWAGLAVMVVPLFMLATDVTVLFLAMPSIAADLAPEGSQSLWILHVGEFITASTMITFGLLAHRIGPRRLLMLAVAFYGVASLVAAYATSPEMLIAGRALLGLGAAGFTPAGLALIRRTFRDPGQYSIAFAMYMAAFTGGAAVGPPFGGLMLEHFWWGSVFLINVPIAAVLLIAGPFLLPRNHADPNARLDPASVVLSVAAVITLVFGLQELADSGPAPLPVASAIAGVVLGVVFIRRQRTAAWPLMDLALFRLPEFRMMLILLFILIGGTAAADMLLAQFLQVVRGMTALEVGLVLLAPALAATFGTMLTPVLARLQRPGIASAMVLTAYSVGFLVLVRLIENDGLYGVVAILTAAGLFGSPVLTLFSQRLISAAPEEKTGPATAIQDVTASLAMGSGLAFVGAGALGVYRQVIHEGATTAIPPGAVDQAADSFGGPLATIAELRDVQAERLMGVVDTAFTAAVQTGYGVAAVSVVIVAVLTSRLDRYLREHPAE